MSDLAKAHCHSANHRGEIEASDIAGCFYCYSTFQPAHILRWIDDGNTALCPKCGIDSVIGGASGFSVTDPEFLTRMNADWF